MVSREKVAGKPRMCSNPECWNWFIPTNNRQRFCCTSCAYAMRSSPYVQAERERARRLAQQTHDIMPTLDKMQPDELLRYGKYQSERYKSVKEGND